MKFMEARGWTLVWCRVPLDMSNTAALAVYVLEDKDTERTNVWHSLMRLKGASSKFSFPFCI